MHQTHQVTVLGWFPHVDQYKTVKVMIYIVSIESGCVTIYGPQFGPWDTVRYIYGGDTLYNMRMCGWNNEVHIMWWDVSPFQTMLCDC